MKKVLLLLVCICLFGLLVNATEHPTLPIGAAAPAFNLKGTDQKMHSLQSFAGANILVIIFTCNHCPTAQAYEDRIIALHNKYAAKGFPVVAINSNDKDVVPEDSYEEMISRAKEFQYVQNDTDGGCPRH